MYRLFLCVFVLIACMVPESIEGGGGGGSQGFINAGFFAWGGGGG